MNALLFVLSTIIHDIQPTKLIERGHLIISTSAGIDDVDVSIEYFLKTTVYTPVPDQKGVLKQALPPSFLTEQGYQDLERDGSMDFRDVKLVFMGHGNRSIYANCYLVHVIKNDGSWDAVAFYHPTIPSTGWAGLDLTFNNIPGLGRYTIHSNVRRQ